MGAAEDNGILAGKNHASGSQSCSRDISGDGERRVFSLGCGMEATGDAVETTSAGLERLDSRSAMKLRDVTDVRPKTGDDD